MKGRASKRRKTSVESDDDVFVADDVAENDVVEEGISAPLTGSIDRVAEMSWGR